MANIRILLVGGGGGQGGGVTNVTYEAGGGAGQVIHNTSFAVSPGSYSVVVGTAGGYQAAGGNSTFSTLTATGGSPGYTTGHGGASGSGQAGGAFGGPYASGGGGGDSAVGGASSGNTPGAGGAGTYNDISGTNTEYGHGGAGNFGGGGVAGIANRGNGWNGTAATGSDGVVIIRYPTADFGVCTGGTITTVGSDTVHTFTTSGTFVLVEKVVVNYLKRYKRTRNIGNLTGQVDTPVSVWTPRDVSGCRLWLDVSQISGLNNGDDISSMSDLSGYGNNLSYVSTAQNPHYTTNAQNGLPVMRHTAAASSTWYVPWPYPAPCTLFYVGKMGTTKSRLLAAKFNNWLMGYWGGYENQAYFNGWVGANSDVAATTNTYVWSAIVNSTSYLWRNGTLVKSGTGGVTAPAGLCIGYAGTSEFSDGDIGEIIGYNRELTTAERQQVENYLKAKWGIA